jgi:hypothetical protein
VGLNPGHRVEKHERKCTNYVMSIVFCSLRQISVVTRVVMTRMGWVGHVAQVEKRGKSESGMQEIMWET